jgi:hypothetical protein
MQTQGLMHMQGLHRQRGSHRCKGTCRGVCKRSAGHANAGGRGADAGACADRGALLAFAIKTMPVFLAVVITAYQAHRCCGTMGKCQQKKGKRKKEESTPLLFVYIVCASCVDKLKSVSRCGTCRNYVTQVHVQLPMFNFPCSNVQHSTFNIQRSSFQVQHCSTFNSLNMISVPPTPM